MHKGAWTSSLERDAVAAPTNGDDEHGEMCITGGYATQAPDRRLRGESGQRPRTGGGRRGRVRRSAAVVVIVLALFGVACQEGRGDRVLTVEDVGVSVRIPTSWSIGDGARPADTVLAEMIEPAVVASGEEAGLMVTRLFEFEDRATTYRAIGSWVEDAGSREPVRGTRTVDGHPVVVLDYELPAAEQEQGQRQHRTQLVDLGDGTHALVDVGVAVGDPAAAELLDNITSSLAVSPSPLPVTTEELPGDAGLVGELWLPDQARGRAAVLMIGGSDGGLPFGRGQLALAGYPTLALAYHGAPGLPDTLAEIPLEYFRDALDWLGSRPGIDDDQLYLWGTSRGGEGVLLIASSFPERVAGVVAHVPANRAGAGFPDSTRAAWTLDGQEVARRTDDGQVLAYNAEIEVEHIDGSVLLTCGEADEVWPSCPMAREIVDRLERHSFDHDVELQAYDDEGHGAALPPRSASRTQRAVGSPGWRDGLDFLDRVSA